MKPLNCLLAGMFVLCMHATSYSQNLEIPDLPQTKEQFPASEKFFIEAAKWLEANQVGKDMDQRTKLNAWVIAWLTNSPSVSITMGKLSLDLSEKNPQLMAMFMAGYGRYVLENNYSKDELLANIAGVRSAINLYKLGGDVKKNKFVQKALDAEKAGTFDTFVKEHLEKQQKDIEKHKNR